MLLFVTQLQIPLSDLVFALSSAIDLINPFVVGHQKRVAYIALSIGEELGLPMEQQEELLRG